MEGYNYNPALRRLRHEHKFKVNLSCHSETMKMKGIAVNML